MTRTRILVADGHAGVRQAVRRLLERQPEWEVIAEADDGWSAVDLATRLSPDVAIVDFVMPRLDGIEVARQMRRRGRATRVLVLSMYTDAACVMRALEAGAFGILLKGLVGDELIDAVTTIARGGWFVSASVAG